MKTMTLSAILSAVMLLASTSVMADLDNQNINNVHNLSKRPYQQLPDESAYQADEKWVGAGMASGTNNAGVKPNDQHLRFHFLGKRPFMEKTPSR